jgi:anti-sigma regulatory factor (Ser/Thr protein kinase)
MLENGLQVLVIQAALAELGRVSAWATELSARLALPAATSYAVQLCLEEAVSNIVRHGFPGRADMDQQTIELALQRSGACAILTIQDGATPFDPTTVPSPARPRTLDDVTLGGQGIHLMRQFSQGMQYERLGERNCLTLRFDLTAGR